MEIVFHRWIAQSLKLEGETFILPQHYLRLLFELLHQEDLVKELKHLFKEGLIQPIEVSEINLEPLLLLSNHLVSVYDLA